MNPEFPFNFNGDPAEYRNNMRNLITSRERIRNSFVLFSLPQVIEDEHINLAAGLSAKLTSSDHIGYVLNPQKDNEDLIISYSTAYLNTSIFFLVPQNYDEKIRTNAIREFSILIQYSSIISDYWTNRTKLDNSETIVNRSRAYMALFLHLAKETYDEQGIGLPLDPDQIEVMEQYPEGIYSLDPKDVYLPPEFVVNSSLNG